MVGTISQSIFTLTCLDVNSLGVIKMAQWPKTFVHMEKYHHHSFLRRRTLYGLHEKKKQKRINVSLKHSSEVRGRAGVKQSARTLTEPFQESRYRRTRVEQSRVE